MRTVGLTFEEKIKEEPNIKPEEKAAKAKTKPKPEEKAE